MVISKETHALTIALHKTGLTGKSITASKIAPQSTICRIIKELLIVAKKAPGRPRRTSKCQDHLLKVFFCSSGQFTVGVWRGLTSSPYKVTSEKLCLAQQELHFQASTYLCLLESVRNHLIFHEEYHGKGEHSFEEVAGLVGFKMPQQPGGKGWEG
ncbi:hypothetical protein GDO81_024014 [Engystomops pustulosus]|uniref:Protein FMC1 homolog n=1 Tax=Engystomops pustulosus TaxID=76066 RepID=A0AAV6Z3G2_ENGPU|nr:hypothetical protein GDO81_024014 [Engystomops pustulosus]